MERHHCLQVGCPSGLAGGLVLIAVITCCFWTYVVAASPAQGVSSTAMTTVSPAVVLTAFSFPCRIPHHTAWAYWGR